MSIRMMALVWDYYPGAGSELLAMLALADWSDDDGRCWPSMASIAKKTRLSEKQARRVVHSIIETGYLSVTDNQQGGATSRRYQIQLDRLTPPAGGTPPMDGSPPAGVPYPSHGREPTPPAGGSRTINEPSVTTNTSQINLIDPPADEFETFWSAYPRKVVKTKAAKAWAKLKPDAGIRAAIHASLELQKQSEQWRKDGGKYIPHPATWLNQCRWEDQAPEGAGVFGDEPGAEPEWLRGAV